MSPLAGILASQNPYPSILLDEVGTPATPGAGTQRLFVDPADHLLKLVDETGTVTEVGGGGVTDHGALTGLADDDHTQYALRSILTTNGDILTRAAGDWARLGIGSAGQVLTVASGAPSWATPAGGSGGALVLLEQHSASSSASLDFSSWYSSTYDDYLFELLNLVPATNNVDLFVRFGNGSADSSGSYSNVTYAASSGGAVATGAAGTTAMKLRNSAEIDNNASGGVTGTMKLRYPGSTGTFRRADLEASYLNGDPVLARTVCEYTGSAGSIVNFVSFLFSSGNISSGIVRCYGIAKS